MPDDAADLAELRERLRATQEAAERLAGSVPAQGWAAVSDHERNATADEIQALVTLLSALRDAVPDELWEQARELIRRLLLVLRALLDVVLERLDEEGGGTPRPRAAGPDVQDIPIA